MFNKVLYPGGRGGGGENSHTWPDGDARRNF